MKPHLLLLLLLAIPPLISNILACENAEKTDPAPATEKAYAAVSKETVPPAAMTPATAPTSPAMAPAKPAPAKGTGNSTGLKAWFIM